MTMMPHTIITSDRDAIVLPLDPFEQLHPRAAGQHDIGQHDIRPSPIDLTFCVRGIGDGPHVVSPIGDAKR